MSDILQDKVAVITGGSRGFGLAIANAYGRAGAAVVIASRSPQTVDKAVGLLKTSGIRAAGITCDVGDLEQVEKLRAYALRTFDRLDIWVNNAGIAGPYGPTVHIAPQTFAQIVQTNILGVYHGSRVALSHFLHQNSGKLVNILGRGERNPTPLQNAYASSKAWVKSFTVALAKEHKTSNVGVFAYNPGMMTTELLTELEAITGFEDQLTSMDTILRMWAKSPAAPAQTMVWLASNATNGRTGIVKREMNTRSMLSGAAKEGLRRLFHRPTPPTQVTVHTILSAFPVPDSEESP